MVYFFKIVQSPVGKIRLYASDKGLAGILWEHDKSLRVPHLKDATEDGIHPLLLEVEQQLDEYFSGKRKAFNVLLDFIGNNFNQKVWAALLTIPYGQTRTYGQIAKQIGKPETARMVGMANSKNPLGIVAPCHRVISANGKLTGFAGGLEIKALLLNLEAKSQHFKSVD